MRRKSSASILQPTSSSSSSSSAYSVGSSTSSSSSSFFSAHFSSSTSSSSSSLSSFLSGEISEMPGLFLPPEVKEHEEKPLWKERSEPLMPEFKPFDCKGIVPDYLHISQHSPILSNQTLGTIDYLRTQASIDRYPELERLTTPGGELAAILFAFLENLATAKDYHFECEETTLNTLTVDTDRLRPSNSHGYLLFVRRMNRCFFSAAIDDRPTALQAELKQHSAMHPGERIWLLTYGSRWSQEFLQRETQKQPLREELYGIDQRLLEDYHINPLSPPEQIGSIIRKMLERRTEINQQLAQFDTMPAIPPQWYFCYRNRHDTLTTKTEQDIPGLKKVFSRLKALSPLQVTPAIQEELFVSINEFFHPLDVRCVVGSGSTHIHDLYLSMLDAQVLKEKLTPASQEEIKNYLGSPLTQAHISPSKLPALELLLLHFKQPNSPLSFLAQAEQGEDKAGSGQGRLSLGYDDHVLQLQFITKLLTAGAQTDVLFPCKLNADSQEHCYVSALLYAFFLDRTDVASLIIQSAADSINGWHFHCGYTATPVMVAVEHNQREWLQFMLSYPQTDLNQIAAQGHPLGVTRPLSVALLRSADMDITACPFAQLESKTKETHPEKMGLKGTLILYRTSREDIGARYIQQKDNQRSVIDLKMTDQPMTREEKIPHVGPTGSRRMIRRYLHESRLQSQLRNTASFLGTGFKELKNLLENCFMQLQQQNLLSLPLGCPLNAILASQSDNTIVLMDLLMQAGDRVNEKDIERLIRNGANFNQLVELQTSGRRSCMSPFMYAMNFVNRLPLISHMLEVAFINLQAIHQVWEEKPRFAPSCTMRVTPAFVAVMKNNLPLLNLLVEIGRANLLANCCERFYEIDEPFSPLKLAVLKTHHAMIHYMLDHLNLVPEGNPEGKEEVESDVGLPSLLRQELSQVARHYQLAPVTHCQSLDYHRSWELCKRLDEEIKSRESKMSFATGEHASRQRKREKRLRALRLQIRQELATEAHQLSEPAGGGLQHPLPLGRIVEPRFPGMFQIRTAVPSDSKESWEEEYTERFYQRRAALLEAEVSSSEGNRPPLIPPGALNEIKKEVEKTAQWEFNQDEKRWRRKMVQQVHRILVADMFEPGTSTRTLARAWETLKAYLGPRITMEVLLYLVDSEERGTILFLANEQAPQPERSCMIS